MKKSEVQPTLEQLMFYGLMLLLFNMYKTPTRLSSSRNFGIWDLKSIGIRGDESSVYDKFVGEVRFNGERYEAKLPFKEQPTCEDEGQDTVLELRNPKPTVMSAVVGTDVQQEQNLENVLDLSKYSKLDKLLRITAYVRRFVVNIRCSLRGEQTSKGPLSAEELDLAEKSWIKQAQACCQGYRNILAVTGNL